MKIRDLKTARDVIEAIGRERVRKITGKGNTNVSNWMTVNRFPPETFHVMAIELQRVRCRAPSALWRMIQPEVRAA